MPLEGRGFSRSQTEFRGLEQGRPAQSGPAELRFYGNKTRRRGLERSGFERDGVVPRRFAVGQIAQHDSARDGAPASPSSRSGFFRFGSGARQLPRNRFNRRQTGWRGPEQRRRSRQ